MIPEDRMEQLIKKAFKEVLEESQLLEKVDNIINTIDRITGQSNQSLYNPKITEVDYKRNVLRNSGKYIHSHGSMKRRILGW